MDIFESLENLNVSEECFNDIIKMIKSMLPEGYTPRQKQQAAQNSITGRTEAVEKAKEQVSKAQTGAEVQAAKDKFMKALNRKYKAINTAQEEPWRSTLNALKKNN